MGTAIAKYVEFRWKKNAIRGSDDERVDGGGRAGERRAGDERRRRGASEEKRRRHGRAEEPDVGGEVSPEPARGRRRAQRHHRHDRATHEGGQAAASSSVRASGDGEDVHDLGRREGAVRTRVRADDAGVERVRRCVDRARSRAPALVFFKKAGEPERRLGPATRSTPRSLFSNLDRISSHLAAAAVFPSSSSQTAASTSCGTRSNPSRPRCASTRPGSSSSSSTSATA